MRLGSYNVENLFDRPKAMSLESWNAGRAVLEKFAQLNQLLGEENYTTTRKRRMERLFRDLGLANSDMGPFVILRRNRGGLVKRPGSGSVEIIADSRRDWSGSLELRCEAIDDEAMRNTARVLIDLKVDVLGVVEAESRPVLGEFVETVVPAMGTNPYHHVMVIDGNDSRGIDVGLMSRRSFPIGLMRSHVEDRDSNGARIFSRDCPEYHVSTRSGENLVILVNHFKSKGWGTQQVNDARRKRQAQQVARIYRRLRNEGHKNVAILGDFNDSPESDSLRPLLGQKELKDVSEFEGFEDGGWPGTFKLCNKKDKLDYILLSPSLFERVEHAGVYRTGMWPGSRPARWEAYGTITRPSEAASDHAALWVDLDI